MKFDEYPLAILKQHASQHKDIIKGYSKMKKGELVVTLTKHLKINKKGDVSRRKKAIQGDGFSGPTLKDFVDSIEEDENKDNPQFVKNPQDSKIIDAIDKMPVLKGPAKQAVDTAGKKVDTIVTKPFEAAMKTAGVPPSAVKVIASYAKPYETTKNALKLMKVSSRQGAIKSGQREKFMGKVLQEAGLFGPDGKIKVSGDEAKSIADAALLAYDVQFPDSAQTKYAYEKNKPPYNRNPEYKKIMAKISNAGIKASGGSLVNRIEKNLKLIRTAKQRILGGQLPDRVTDKLRDIDLQK